MVVGGRELIDTLWNVNNQTKPITNFRHRELIDTLWNVNICHPLSNISPET